MVIGRADYTMMLSLFMTPKKYLELISFKANGLIIKRATVDYIGQVTYPDSVSLIQYKISDCILTLVS
jgi:hypothetical protein